MNFDLIDYTYIARKKLNKKRFIHTIGVVQTARKLAKFYNINEEKVMIASILHDISKNESIQRMRQVCKKYFIEELSDEDLNNDNILHGFYAVYWIKTQLKIYDDIILNAIKYHTIGHKDMTIEAKIVYIADAIEPSRNYKNVDKLREYAFQNIDYAILKEIEYKADYLNKQNLKLHKNTEDLYTSLKELNFNKLREKI